MQSFKYRALDANGGALSGFLDAENPEKAASQLQERGWLVLHIESSTSDASPGFMSGLQRQSLNAVELARFTQQLATLMGAGQPLERALNTLVRQPGKPQAQRLLERIRNRVKGGQTLSSAMSLEGTQFSALYLGLIKAGEAGGELAETLTQLTAYLERAQKVKNEVINALIYPAFLIVGVLGSLILLLVYVVPQFVPIFSGLGVPVPRITEAILGFGQMLSDYGLYLMLAFIAAVLLFNRRLSSPAGRLSWDKHILRWRIAGPLLLRLETARLTHTLGTLLSQGVPLIASFDIALLVCRNQAIRTAVEQVIVKVKDGSRLSKALEAESVFPDLAIQMIQVGEESGTLDAMLLKVASVYDEDAKRSIDRLLAALVPSLTLVMAALVAMIMIAIMLPLMNLTSSI